MHDEGQVPVIRSSNALWVIFRAGNCWLENFSLKRFGGAEK